MAIILRGALGGALGGFILLLISFISSIGHISYPHLYLLAIPLALLIGGVIGVIVGAAVWLLGLLSGRQFGCLSRGIIGFATAVIALFSFAYLRPEQSGLAHEPLSWTQHALNWLMMGMVLAALPGIMARQVRKEG